jgi:hypothetical protein
LNKFLKDKGFAPTEEPFKKTDQSGNDLGLVLLFIEFYGVEYASEKDEDMLKQMFIFLSKTKYDKILKGD